MKTKTKQRQSQTTATLIAILAALGFLPMAGFAQAPPAPPAPPSMPVPPDRHEHERGPKVPVIFLGVETSEVPSVVSEQLGLAKGFGLVVDYVVPGSPAATAGLQQNDILKMLNDQILIDPNQLRKLLQTFQDGTTVTLTILRKGQEQKVTAKLTKKEMPQRHSLLPGFEHSWDMGEFGEQMQNLKEQLQEQLGAQRGVIRDAVMRAREEARRARDEARHATDQIRVQTRNGAGFATTKIDLGKAQIVFSDDKGEMKLENVDGKKILTAKDGQGKLLFSGPVETKEEIDKLPPEIRQRYEKLEQNDLPTLAPPEAPNASDEGPDDADEEVVNQV
jgi:serine protease Do